MSSLLVAAVALAASYLRLNANITRLDVSGQLGTERPTDDRPLGALNILLIGSDSRATGQSVTEDGSDNTDARSDTNLIVHLSADRTSATVVSIPRDSMTLAPPNCSPDAKKSEWEIRQWNWNFSEGGPGCLIRTVEGTTGLFIDHFAIVDFEGFKDMVDALGGVPICTPEPINDPKAHLELAAGTHVLDGTQALGYVRARKTIGDGSDLGRIKRQQTFLSAVIQEATKTSFFLRPDRVYAFLDAATRSLTTDPGFGVSEMKDVAESVKNLGMERIQFITVPVEDYPNDTNRVRWTAAADQLWAALRADRQVVETGPATSTPTPITTTPLTVSPADVRLRVVNASGRDGWAGQTSRALAVQGFVVTGQASAQESADTLVEYTTGFAEAARTVAAALPGAKTVEVPGSSTTIVVTLGTASKHVVEVPNRTGTDPLPNQSIPEPTSTPAFDVRTADEDICTLD